MHYFKIMVSYDTTYDLNCFVWLYCDAKCLSLESFSLKCALRLQKKELLELIALKFYF